MRIQSFFDRAFVRLQNDSGFTLSQELEDVRSGFAVGLGRAGAQSVTFSWPFATPEQVIRALAELVIVNATVLAKNPNACLGGWINERGECVLEPSAVYADRDEAMRFAAEKGEEAIYDLAAGAEIKVERPFDAVAFISAFEGDELTEEQVTEGFQHLVDSGLAWQLQGSYGRLAQQMIDAGLVQAR